MIVADISNILNDYAPLAYTEDFDNTGLLVGDAQSEVKGILVTLDTTEAVIDEAIAKKCNLVVSFHPIIFTGLKKLTGDNYVTRTVQKAIKNDIAIYAIHTALDNSQKGVNSEICSRLGLQKTTILSPKSNTILKLVTYVPKNEAELVRTALFDVGVGSIGNYSNCSFNVEGTGTYKGEAGSDPQVGEVGELRMEDEVQIGVILPKRLKNSVLRALLSSHPYEEVAYEITELENTNQNVGMGMIGEFEEAIDELQFLELVKKKMNTGCIRHSSLRNKPIKKVAVLGGSGSFAIEQARSAGADAFVSADFKYHDFFKAENKILLCDIGHYESEQYTKELLVDVLTKKIRNFAPPLPKGKVVLSETNTNPISYF